MKREFQPRPQSKNIDKTMRPASPYNNPEMAQNYFKKGKQQQKNGAYGKAIQHYTRALLYNPRYFQAYCNMGSCFRSQSKYLQSRSMYMKSIAIKSDDAITHYNLANVLRIIGNYEDSIKHYEFVINLTENQKQNIGSLYIDSLVNLGVCYKTIKQYEKAFEYYQKARKIDGNDESIIFNQAMALMASLQTLNTDIFQQVSKEKALKAQQLFNRLPKNSQNNEMTQIKLCRISYILNKSNNNLNSIVSKLKQLLINPKSNLKDQINQELGYVLNLLKEYQKSSSHYQKSMSNQIHRKSSRIISANIYDSQNGFINSKRTSYTQEQAIKLIQQGNIAQVQQYIARLEDNNMQKHVLQMAIEVELSQQEQGNHLIKAKQIYSKYFMVNGQQISFQKTSIEAHKIIGKLLSKINKYKESIKHFEYISSQLKSNEQKSQVYSSLGNDYDALGDKQKALEQYRKALEQQPQNYQLIYNIGYCLHQSGNHTQSNKYFQQFLVLIEKDMRIDLPTKNIYIADCLITLAGTSTNTQQEYNYYERAWKAIIQVQAQKQQKYQFQKQKLMNFYLRWADLLEEKLMSIANKKSQDFICLKQTLLQVYMNLLQDKLCPDKDAILNNAAILFYQSKLYLSSLANLNQVASPTPLSLNSLALTYLHLGEHFMATKFIYAATQITQLTIEDPIIQFNKQVIEWIYGISNEGRLNDLIDNKDDNLIIARWQYGVLLIDALSQKLKNSAENQDLSEIISNMIKNKNIADYLNEVDKVKYKFVSNILHNKGNNSSSNITQQMLQKCLKKSGNIEQDTKYLVQALQSEKDLSENIIQLILNIFIYTNKDKSNKIHHILSQLYPKNREVISIQMDRKVTITQDLKAKQLNFNGFKDIVVNFCNWQCDLQDKLITLIYSIEKHYYQSKFRSLLEIEYRFPRHTQIQYCSSTLNRMVNLIYRLFQVKSNINPKEKTLSLMKGEILKEIESDFLKQMRNSVFIPVVFGPQFTFLTIHANFESIQQCIKFIKDLQKDCSNRHEVEVAKNTKEISVIISQVIEIRCTWHEKSILETIIKSTLQSPLQLYLQSIIEVQQNLSFLKDSDKSTWEKITKALLA